MSVSPSTGATPPGSTRAGCRALPSTTRGRPEAGIAGSGHRTGRWYVPQAMGRRPGRPRATGDPHEQRDTRQDVLDAAAALFCTVGYAATSTRAVADRAGVRQASIYHHFTSKDAILLDLLLGSVRPSVDLADRLATAADAPPAARLWALAHADVLLLTTSPVNVGALYLLPEVDGEQFAEFHALRDRLRARYDDLAAQVLAAPVPTARTPAAQVLAAQVPAPDDLGVGTSAATDVVPVETAGPLVLGLVESVILRRRAGERLDDGDVARSVADGVLRLLGVDAGAIGTARAGSAHVLPAVDVALGGGSGVPAAASVPRTTPPRAAAGGTPTTVASRAVPATAPDVAPGATSADATAG